MPGARRFPISTIPPSTDEDELLTQPSVLVRAFRAGETMGPPPELTPREAEIVALLADDLDTEQIAQRLTISRHTVRSHIEKMRLKYKKRSIAGIVAIALRRGWVK
jgi:DNA-binding CsgD family transcriptional regulator